MLEYLAGVLEVSWWISQIILGALRGYPGSIYQLWDPLQHLSNATLHYHLNNAATMSNQHPYPQETTRRSQDNQRIPSGYPRIPEVWCELVGSGGVLARAG